MSFIGGGIFLYQSNFIHVWRVRISRRTLMESAMKGSEPEVYVTGVELHFARLFEPAKKKHVSVSSPMDSATDYGWGFLSPDKSRGRPTSSFTQQIWRLPDFCLFVCLFSTAVTVVHNLKKKDPVTTLLPKTKRSFPFKRCVDRNGIAGAKQIP